MGTTTRNTLHFASTGNDFRLLLTSQPKQCVRGLPVRLFVATNRRPLSLGLSGHEEFEETIQTLPGHLLLYVVPGGERLYGHEVARAGAGAVGLQVSATENLVSSLLDLCFFRLRWPFFSPPF